MAVQVENESAIARMEKALDAFGRGEMVMVMDSADREDECDLIIAAEKCTVEQMAFMIRQSTGIICLTTTKARLEGFGLHPATGNNTDPNGTNFYVSTDYLEGTTTGVSAADRLATLRAFCDPTIPADKFSKPGHMFPLCANPDGVLARQGHTESTFDFCRLAPGIKHPVGALAELMHDDGTMFREGDSRRFAEKYALQMVYVSDIIAYRMREEERNSSIRRHRFGTDGLSRTVSEVSNKSMEKSKNYDPASRSIPFAQSPPLSFNQSSQILGLNAGNVDSVSELKINSCSTAPTNSLTVTNESKGLQTASAKLRSHHIQDECKIIVKKTTDEDQLIENDFGSISGKVQRNMSNLEGGVKSSVINNVQNGFETVLVIKGDVNGKSNVPVRIHSECFTGDTLKSMLCDCGTQLDSFLQVLDRSTCGVLVYIRGHEGRGIGLFHKIQAYHLQQTECVDTVEANERLGFNADLRKFDDAVNSLVELGIHSVVLYSNNPDKQEVLKTAFDGRLSFAPLSSAPNRYNLRYLETKQIKQGHRTVMSEFDPLLEDGSLERGLIAAAKSRQFNGCVVIVHTMWNQNFVLPIVKKCKEFLETQAKIEVELLEVPGHTELVRGTQVALRCHNPSAVIAIGVVVENPSSGTALSQTNCVVHELHHLTTTQRVPIVQGISLSKYEDHAFERAQDNSLLHPGEAYAKTAVKMMQIVAMEAAAPEIIP